MEWEEKKLVFDSSESFNDKEWAYYDIEMDVILEPQFGFV